MNIQSYAKKDIAANQIETALGLYFEGRDLFSVITLAGAAEEILGQLLQGRNGKAGSFRSIWENLRPGRRKTPGSEGQSGQESESHIHMDLQQEARFLLGRAIDDYHALTGTLSENMVRFKRTEAASSL